MNIILFILTFIIIITFVLFKRYRKEHFKLDNPFDRCFVITINETEEGRNRWLRIKNNPILKHFIEKFNGIYGKNYNYRNEIMKGIITTTWDYGKWKHKKSNFIPMTKGENINNVLILEDDANKVHNSFIDTINIILKYVPDDWDIILLGYLITPADKLKQINDYIWKVNSFVLCHSYLINKKGVQKILKNLPINMPLDAWLSTHSDKINIYRHNIYTKHNMGKISTLIMQNSHGSDIIHTNVI